MDKALTASLFASVAGALAGVLILDSVLGGVFGFFSTMGAIVVGLLIGDEVNLRLRRHYRGR